MKRLFLIFTALIISMGLFSTVQAQGWGKGHGGGMGSGGGQGYGMGGGMGGGFGHGGGMGGGHGYGMGGGMGGMGSMITSLPTKQRKAMRQLRDSMMPAMMKKRDQISDLRANLQKIMQSFPLKTRQAEKIRKKINKAKEEMFSLKLAMMSQAQKILGKNRWTEMHGQRGPGTRHGM